MEEFDGVITFVGALLLCGALTLLTVFSVKLLNVYEALEETGRGALLVF